MFMYEERRFRVCVYRTLGIVIEFTVVRVYYCLDCGFERSFFIKEIKK